MGSLCEGEAWCSVSGQTGGSGGTTVLPEADNWSGQITGGLWAPTSGNLLRWPYPLPSFSRTQVSFLLGPQGPLVPFWEQPLAHCGPCLPSPGSVPPACMEVSALNYRQGSWGAALRSSLVLIRVCFCFWSLLKLSGPPWPLFSSDRSLPSSF